MPNWLSGAFTSASLRLYIGSSSFSLRSHLGPTSISLRFHTDRFRFDLAAMRLRFHFEWLSTKLITKTEGDERHRGSDTHHDERHHGSRRPLPQQKLTTKQLSQQEAQNAQEPTELHQDPARSMHFTKSSADKKRRRTTPRRTMAPGWLAGWLAG